MKTVMKKIFSLMLVAVLLVSALPFQASAAETTLSYDLSIAPGNYNVDDLLAAQGYTGSSTNYWVHRTAPSAEDYVRGASFTAVEGGTYTLYVVEQIVETQPEPTTEPTTEPAPQLCETCSKEAHEGVCCATCKELGHVAADHCATCGELGHAAASHCDTCKDYPCTCPDIVSITFINELTGDRTVVEAEVGEVITLPTIAYVNGYSINGWNFNGTIRDGKYTVAANAPAKVYADYDKTAKDDKNALKVYARLYTGGVLRKTELIHQNNSMMTNDAILEYLMHPDTNAQLNNTIKNSYPGYSWSGHIYNARGEEAATNNLVTTDGAKNVYINLYSEAKQVLVYVHTTSRSDNYVRIIEIDGYKAGETVSYNTVASAVKYYYTFGDMAMFDQTGWNDYLAKKDATDTKHVVVGTGDVTKIHVRLYGVGNGSTSTADSSNPKTGDMIFVPAAVMGLSASALAVLFFLNKKRAY